MNFPSFITTGPAKDIQTAPLEHKPFNLLPLIQLLKEDEQKASSSKKTAESNDFKIEGRIGGVNQIMEKVNKEQARIKTGLSLLGDAFTLTPEYAAATRALAQATSPEVLNVLDRQTSDVKRFESNIKDKGHYFHIAEWGRGRSLDRMSSWKNKLERGESYEFYGDGSGDYVEDFDFDPVVYGMEDFRKAVDELYKTGWLSDERGWSSITEEFVKNLYGIKETHSTQSWKKNYNESYNPKTGEYDIKDPIGRGQLAEAYEQSLGRAFAEGIDFTDPISAGAWQGFLQRQAGNGNDPLKKYKGKDGTIDDKGFDEMITDFQDFVNRDLEKHYEKRKDKTTKFDQTQNFTESVEGTKMAGAIAEAAEMADGFRQLPTSVEALTDYGLSEDDFIGKKGGMGDLFAALKELNFEGAKTVMSGDLTDQEKTLIYEDPTAPFYKQNVNGVSVINTNVGYDPEAYKATLVKYATERGIKDPNKFAEGIIAKVHEKRVVLETAKANGKTVKATGRQEIIELHKDAVDVPDWIKDATNSEHLIGQTTEEFGLNMFTKIGNSYMMLGDIKGLKYMGTEGGVKVTQNTIPTNMYTVYEDENGKVQYYNWTDSRWRSMSDQQKQSIIEKSQAQAKKDGRFGTMLLNSTDKKLAKAVEKSSAIPMDAFTEKYLAKAAMDPTSSLSGLFASNGAITVTGSFMGDSEAHIAKAFGDKTIAVELPASYSTNREFRKAYDDVSYNWKNFGKPIMYEFIKRAKGDKPDTNVIADHLGIKEKKEFNEYINNLPENLPYQQYMYAIADFKIGKRGGYKNKEVVLTNVKVSDDGKTINPYARDVIGLSTVTVKENGKDVTKHRVLLEFDATSSLIKGQSNPSIRKQGTTFVQKSLYNYNVARGLVNDSNPSQQNKFSGIKAKD